MTDEGVFPKIDGDVLYAEDLNLINPYIRIIYGASISVGLIKFSDSIWQTEAYRTTNTGASWSAGGYGSGYTAATSGASGITIKEADGTGPKQTTDSGANWTASSTSPPNITAASSIYMFSTTLGVIGGTAGAGNYIWYTTDGGDNWTQATTGPTADVRAIVMASATIGYAVDSNQNIWKTTDGGINWTDTTDNTSNVVNHAVAIDTDTILFAFSKTCFIEHYVNSTNTVTNLFAPGTGPDRNATTNFVTVDSRQYIVWSNGAVSSDGEQSVGMIHLFRYDGTNLDLRLVSTNQTTDMSGVLKSATNEREKPCMIESGGSLYVNIGNGNIFRIYLQ